uniref:Titin n=1 Tax=Cyprinodon variegatus TaxID=28743 RepID=A0A3Q2EIM8_CYPVA
MFVKESKLSDGGQYTLLLRNPGGEKATQINVVILDKPGEPQGPLVVTGVTKDHCSLAWKPPIQDGGSKISHYIVERRETSRLVWTVVDPKVQNICLKVNKLLEGDEYIFRVHAVNQFGVGAPLESAPVIIKDPYVLPGTPKNLEVSDVKKDSMVLSWEAPSEDGGCPITGYIIEKHDKEGVRWTRCNRQTVTDLTFKVTGLLESHIYEFRVAAENSVGIGEPSTPTVFYKALDPIFRPGPPQNPKVTDTTKSSVFLSWGKPVCDGGCEIQSYIVECSIATEPVVQPDAPDESVSATDVSAEEWIICTPPTGVKTTKFEVKNLKENQAYKFRVCAINKVGVGEHADVSGAVVAQDRTEEPDLDIDPELRKIVTIKAGASLRLFIPIKGRPTPTIKWDKDEAPLKETAQVEITSSYTSLVIDKMSRNDSGKYTVTAQNSSGTKSAFVVVRVLDTPSAPVDLKVEEITNQSVTLAWKPPLLDGGSKIKNYIIEKRESTRKTYAYKPGAPTYLNVIDSTKTSITVSWGKPLTDGGSAIQGYIVEVCQAEKEEWAMVTPPTGLRVNKYEIPKLTEGQEYKIQVCALNKMGVGEPVVLSGTAKPEERTDPPQIHLDSELRKGITIKAGGSVRIYVPFKGRPIPEIKWTKDDGDLSEKAVVEKAVNFTQLSIDCCDRHDSGKYTLSLTNSSGCVSEFVSVKVLDTPGSPQNLVVKDIRKDSVTLVWDAPVIDGGSKIKNYVIDKRESTRKAYANVSTKCTKTTFKVENLIEGAMYYFRVMAENEYGIGQAVETKTASKASEVPLPVGKVFLTDVTKNSATLAWEKPEHDGGSRIGGYLIEMQPKGTDKWGVAANPKTCEGTVVGLTAGTEYLFRIIAYNEKGKSEPKALAAPVIANDMTIEPSIKMQFNTYSVLAGKDLKLEFPVLGRPKPKVSWTKDGQALKVTSRVNVFNTPLTTGIQITEACKDDFGKYSLTATMVEVSNTFVHLSWEPPVYTGGCQVKNYIVEKRDTTTQTWQTVVTQLARTAFKVTKLKTGAEYQFRIIAENRYGKSAALDSKAIVVQYPYKPPGPPGTPRVKSATKEMMIIEWNEPVTDGGSAIIGYHLESKERSSILWNKLNKTRITDTQFKTCNLEEGIGTPLRDLTLQ